VKNRICLCAAGALLSAAGASADLVWGINNFNGPNGSNQLVTFDTNTPATINTIGETGIAGALFSGLVWHPNGTLYGLNQTDRNVYSINPATGAATLVGASGILAPEVPTGMTYDNATGLLQVVSAPTGGLATNTRVYTINPANGAATLFGNFASTAQVLPIDIAADGAGNLYMHDINTDFMYSLSGASATPLSQGAGWNANFSQGMDINWSGSGIWWVATINAGQANQDQLWTINPATGAGTFVAETGGPGITHEFGDITFEIIPAPGAIALLGLAGLVSSRRRRN
jgi:hypothetical protein